MSLFLTYFQKQLNLLKLYGPFLMMEFNYLKATDPLRGDSLLFTTKSQDNLVLIWSTLEE